jgi:hypothetical protein
VIRVAFGLDQELSGANQAASDQEQLQWTDFRLQKSGSGREKSHISPPDSRLRFVRNRSKPQRTDTRRLWSDIRRLWTDTSPQRTGSKAEWTDSRIL